MILFMCIFSCDDKPDLSDSDGDNIVDIVEASLGTDPTTPDSDGDGLPDDKEYYVYHTDPLHTDSDGDGDLDGWEVDRGRDPLNPQQGRYRSGFPMLTLAEKERLLPEQWDVYGRENAKLKRVFVYDIMEESFDIYDLAKRGRLMLLNSSQGPYYVHDWIIEDRTPPPGVPDWIRQYVIEGTVDFISIYSIQTSSDSLTGSTAARALAEYYKTWPPNMLFYADDHAALWAFLNRPIGDHHFWLIDDKMVIRAVDDFPLMKRLIDEGLP